MCCSRTKGRGARQDAVRSGCPQKNGYELAAKDTTLPDETGTGVIRCETSEGKVIVSEELSPPLYDATSRPSGTPPAPPRSMTRAPSTTYPKVYKNSDTISEADVKPALSKPYIPVADRGMLARYSNVCGLPYQVEA